MRRAYQPGFRSAHASRLYGALYFQIQDRHLAISFPIEDYRVFAQRQIVARRAEQRDEVASILKARLNHALYIFDQTYHADDWCGQNSASFRLVVERNVPGHDGSVECAAGLGNAVD